MIAVEGLSKSFGSVDVLRGIDLQCPAGDRIALVGQNGSGKTTLIRCLLGLYDHRGTITIDGFHARSDRRRALARLGFVPQLPPGLRARVGDYLQTVSSLTGASVAHMTELAAELGLEFETVRRRRFTALSGGMKQKLMIAVAIARRPSILVMDEPGANLDPTSRASFYRQLARVAPTTTMLLSSHRLDEIANLVNRVIELDAGKIVMDDVVAARSSLEAANRRVRVGCRIPDAPDSAARTLGEWGLILADGEWQGEIPAADRFRFLAAINRYAGLIEAMSLDLSEGEPE